MPWSQTFFLKRDPMLSLDQQRILALDIRPLPHSPLPGLNLQELQGKDRKTTGV